MQGGQSGRRKRVGLDSLGAHGRAGVGGPLPASARSSTTTTSIPEGLEVPMEIAVQFLRENEALSLALAARAGRDADADADGAPAGHGRAARGAERRRQLDHRGRAARRRRARRAGRGRRARPQGDGVRRALAAAVALIARRAGDGRGATGRPVVQADRRAAARSTRPRCSSPAATGTRSCPPSTSTTPSRCRPANHIRFTVQSDMPKRRGVESRQLHQGQLPFAVA